MSTLKILMLDSICILLSYSSIFASINTIMTMLSESNPNLCQTDFVFGFFSYKLFVITTAH